MKLKRILALVFAVLAVFFISACDNEETTEPHVHVFGEWETVKDATCEENGEEKRICACGTEEKQDVPAKGHTEVVDKAVVLAIGGAHTASRMHWLCSRIACGGSTFRTDHPLFRFAYVILPRTSHRSRRARGFVYHHHPRVDQI